MNRCLLRLIPLLVAATVAPAHALTGTSDVAPAATLLLPYFEVGLDETTVDVNTTFVVTNLQAAPTLMHVMIFTDYAVGTFAFDVYMTGFDVQSFDLRELFRGEAVMDTCPQGAFSTKGEEAPCNTVLVFTEDSPVTNPPPPPLSDIFDENFETGRLDRWTLVESRITEERLHAYHTGGASEENLCAGVDYGDDIARGFILIDQSERLAGDAFPDEVENYFDPDNDVAVAGTWNILMGEYSIQNHNESFSFSNNMVHIESTADQFIKGFLPTFYQRYTGTTEADQREVLTGKWGARYENGGMFTNGASVMYWRDPEVIQHAFPCDTPPDWAPLSQNFVAVFDETGNGMELENVSPFPYVCGRVGLGSEALPSPFEFGWVYVDFNAVDTVGSSENQGIIVTNFNAEGRFGAGHFGIPFDNAPTDPAEDLFK